MRAYGRVRGHVARSGMGLRPVTAGRKLVPEAGEVNVPAEGG